MKIYKRDGRVANFHKDRIINAINNAYISVYGLNNNTLYEQEINPIMNHIMLKIDLYDNKSIIQIEKIQKIILKTLKKYNNDVYNEYLSYSTERNKTRNIKSDLMKAVGRIGQETDRDNANVGNNFSSKLLRIASETNKIYNLSSNMSKDEAKLHENGDIYIHDLDSYNLAPNCLHIPTRKLLYNGVNTGYGTLNAAKRIETASELSCIILQATQNDMFGGQSHPNFDNDLSIFVDKSRQEIKNEYSKLYKDEGFNISEEKLNKKIEDKLRRVVSQSMQGIVYNLNTMHSRAGSQVPFSSLNIGIPENTDAALICELFLKEFNKGLGKGEECIFPNIIFRVKEGVNREPSDPYYYLYQLACKVAAKRMNPTFMNIDTNFNREYYDRGLLPATMGCRTYLMSNVNGEPGCEGRGNNAPCTINLVRIGLEALRNYPDTEKERIKYFYNLLNTRLQQSRELLLHRRDVLYKLKVKDLPFVAGEGLMRGSENLNPEDSIKPIVDNGTFAIGFIGLAETLIALTGKHHGESKDSQKLGLEILTHMRSFCDKHKYEDKVNWSLYATPAEGLCGKLIKLDRKKYGSIERITDDRGFYTNSFHVPVDYPISIQEKIDIEAPYHELCNGGFISYVEVDGYPTQDDIQKIIDYSFKNTNIGYIGINFHIRYCKECGEYINGSTHKCPKCGSTKIQGVSRVTGYLSLDERFGEGKYNERKVRTSSNGVQSYKNIKNISKF